MVDGILADLGVSSYQFDKPERGFSIRHESKLDMRMNKNGELNASEILNNYSEAELSKIFHEYSDLRNSRSIAKLIIEKRNENKIISTEQFNKILDPFLSKGYENKTRYDPSCWFRKKNEAYYFEDPKATHTHR